MCRFNTVNIVLISRHVAIGGALEQLPPKLHSCPKTKLLPAGCAKRIPACIVFTHMADFSGFLPLIGSGVWVYGPQNYENFEFYQYYCP